MPVYEKPPFVLNMSKPARILGWCYLPVHIFVLPLLLNIYASVSADGLSDRAMNIIYYGIGAAFVLVFMLRYLRADLDPLLDHKIGNLLLLVSGYFMDLLLSYAALIALEFILGAVSNPNEQALDAISQNNYSMMLGLAVFLAPMVEEPLFRGVVFGTLREKNTVLAYLVSVLLFSLYHVWQYAVAYWDAGLLIYMIQYIPVSFVLAWLYDRSRTIWLPIIFHMFLNAMALSYM